MTSSLYAGVTAFRETYIANGDENAVNYDWPTIEARRLRYSLYQALYDHSIYRSNVHIWSASYRQQLGLYRYVRAVESPAASIASFWQTHLYGGALDKTAANAGALPIETENEALRPAIAQLWRWSNWSIEKDTLALQGAILGDIGLKIVDDRARQKVYLQLVHPSTICALDFDPTGNVRGYVFEELREHPISGKAVTYREKVSRDGEDVLYQTYLDTQPYPWPGNEDATGQPRAEWREPYGFVPFVWLNHIKVGSAFGLSELHQGLVVFRELDDIGSALDDQIRKAVNSGWLFAGVDDPKRSGGSDPRMPTTTPTATRPEPGRQEIPILYGPLGATATPLVFPLDIAGTNARIDALHGKLRREYPELEADIETSAGDASGRALRVARQKAETKTKLRRGSYDNALVRAHQMGVTIGGFRRLPGFESFSLDSYTAGQLEHEIGDRPVFAVSTMDTIEEDQAFWAAADTAQRAGYPLELYLADHGWDQAKIDAYLKVKTERAAQAQAQMQRQAQFAQGGQDDGNPA